MTPSRARSSGTLLSARAAKIERKLPRKVASWFWQYASKAVSSGTRWWLTSHWVAFSGLSSSSTMCPPGSMTVLLAKARLVWPAPGAGGSGIFDMSLMLSAVIFRDASVVFRCWTMPTPVLCKPYLGQRHANRVAALAQMRDALTCRFVRSHQTSVCEALLRPCWSLLRYRNRAAGGLGTRVPSLRSRCSKRGRPAAGRPGSGA